MCVKSQENGANEGLAWYEKDLPDFEIENEEINQDEENIETGTTTRVNQEIC